MTTHRHKDGSGRYTTSVTDPDLAPYALASALALLTARVAKLEAAVVPPVVKAAPASGSATLSWT